MHISLCTLVLAMAAAPVVHGHSWIEQVRAINSNGQYVGEYGYPRGYKSKTAPGYNGETDMVYLLPPAVAQPPFINASHLLCHPNQRKQVQSANFPRLQASAGGWLALRYAENGHVSNPSPLNGHIPGQLDAQRRENGGSVFVFGTSEPKEDETIANVLQWTQDGQGGDKRGVLLAVNDYDDGRCYENNPVNQAGQRWKEHPNYVMGQAPQAGAAEPAAIGFPLMCESNVAIPKTAPNGKPYALYWVWQWPMDPSAQSQDFKNGKDEYYTTCLDVDVVETIKEDAKMQYALAPQDAMSVAVKNYRGRKALITNPIEGEVGPVFKDIPTPTGGAPPASQGTLLPSAPPFANSTAGLRIPTRTKRPALKPTSAPVGLPSSAPVNDGIVTIIVTERVTVTASAAVQSVAPSAKRSEHVARHKNGDKLRRIGH